MPEDFQFDVFLSHSAKDNVVVRALAERLRQDALKVWLDEWVIKPGDSIPAKIEDGLEHSRVLVLCMSANAFGSDWVQMESQTYRFRDPLNKERRLIPVRLDDAPIKGSLAQFLYINWHGPDREQEYKKVLESCRHPEACPPPLELRRSPAHNTILTGLSFQNRNKVRINTCRITVVATIIGLLALVTLSLYHVTRQIHNSSGRSEVNITTVGQIASNIIGVAWGENQIPDIGMAKEVVAAQYKMTRSELHRALLEWAANRKASSNIVEMADAELLTDQFASAAMLYDEGAKQRLRDADQAPANSTPLRREAARLFFNKGVAQLSIKEFEGALKSFEQAQETAPIEDTRESRRLRAITYYFATTHNALGLSGGLQSSKHRNNAVKDIESSIQLGNSNETSLFDSQLQEVYGFALFALAQENVYDRKKALLGAYRKALQNASGNRSANLQDLLGGALLSNCLLTASLDKMQARQLAEDAVEAFRKAVAFYSPQTAPDRWSMIQMALSKSLRAQSKLSDKPESERLFREAAGIEKAVKKFSRGTY